MILERPPSGGLSFALRDPPPHLCLLGPLRAIYARVVTTLALPRATSRARGFIADITNPKSSPLELQATVPEITVSFQPIIERGEKALRHAAGLAEQALGLGTRSHRVLAVLDLIEYSPVDKLVETMDAEIIDPAERRFDELVVRRAEVLKVRRV